MHIERLSLGRLYNWNV